MTIEGEIRHPSTLEEYFEFAERCEYRIEYSNGDIVSTEPPSDIHELLCGNVGWVFNSSLDDCENFRVYGSNLGIYIEQPGVQYKPDISVLNAVPEHILHKVGKRTFKSILNPFAVIEVFPTARWTMT